jgi:hypothetical protein
VLNHKKERTKERKKNWSKERKKKEIESEKDKIQKGQKEHAIKIFKLRLELKSGNEEKMTCNVSTCGRVYSYIKSLEVITITGPSNLP